MTDSRGVRHRPSTGPFVGASLLIHVLGLIVLLWSGALDDPERPDDPKQRDEPFEVSLVEEEEQTRESPDKPTPEQPDPSQPVPQQQTPPPPERRRRKTVQQETNDKRPEDAKFRSDKANRVPEETRARRTTQKNVEPDRQQGEAAQKQGEPTPSDRPADQPNEPERDREQSQRAESDQRQQQQARPKREPREAEPEVPTRREPRADEGQKKVPDSQEEVEEVEKLPMPTVSDYDELNDGSADRELAEKEREKGAGHGMFERIEKSKGSLKASLENYITEVQPGNHTAVNATADAAATYISKIHRKIHPKWGGEYLPHLDGAYGPGHPLSNTQLNTVLEFVVDGDSGKLKSVNMVQSSGRVEFDSEAISISKMVAPHPPAPPSVVSPDGDVYLHWNFWRDQRQCGTFGVSIYKVDKQGTRQPVKEAPVDQNSAAQASPK